MPLHIAAHCWGQHHHDSHLSKTLMDMALCARLSVHIRNIRDSCMLRTRCEHDQSNRCKPSVVSFAQAIPDLPAPLPQMHS